MPNYKQELYNMYINEYDIILVKSVFSKRINIVNSDIVVKATLLPYQTRPDINLFK